MNSVTVRSGVLGPLFVVVDRATSDCGLGNRRLLIGWLAEKPSLNGAIGD